jgi:hypothetical protein
MDPGGSWQLLPPLMPTKPVAQSGQTAQAEKGNVDGAAKDIKAIKCPSLD